MGEEEVLFTIFPDGNQYQQVVGERNDDISCFKLKGNNWWLFNMTL